MKQSIRFYLISLVFLAGFCFTKRAYATLPFEPIAAPQKFTIRNFFSWSDKIWGLLQASRGTKYIDSSDTYLQEQGASLIQSSQNAFACSRAWANYRSWFPPINWILNTDLRNPWHLLALATVTGLTGYGTYYAIKKLREKYRQPADQVPAQQPANA